MAPKLVPAHSNSPWSLDTPNVISVGSVLTPILSRNLRKFAEELT
jgi:hypothetical protein